MSEMIDNIKYEKKIKINGNEDQTLEMEQLPVWNESSKQKTTKSPDGFKWYKFVVRLCLCV